MQSTFHRWWLGACVAALLLASWVGGFSVAVTSVFIVIYLTGVTLIGPDDAPAESVESDAAEPVDVVAADPEWIRAPADRISQNDESAEEIPAGEITAVEVTADATAVEIPAEVPADTEAVVVYESATAAEQELLIVEDGTDAETTVVDDHDAVPYPDDFDDEDAAADLHERSPA